MKLCWWFRRILAPSFWQRGCLYHLASHHIDSGISDDEHWLSTSRTESLTSSDQHSSANNIDQSDQKDYIVAIASNDDFGEYVEMSLDSEKTPPLPKRRGENPSIV
jgi:hypothetical protein